MSKAPPLQMGYPGEFLLTYQNIEYLQIISQFGTIYARNHVRREIQWNYSEILGHTVHPYLLNYSAHGGRCRDL